MWRCDGLTKAQQQQRPLFVIVDGGGLGVLVRSSAAQLQGPGAFETLGPEPWSWSRRRSSTKTGNSSRLDFANWHPRCAEDKDDDPVGCL